MEHDIVPGCLHWRRATYEDWRLWTLIVRPLLFLAQVVSDSFVVAVTLSGGPKLHLNSYSTDDMIASGSLLLERFPLCFALKSLEALQSFCSWERQRLPWRTHSLWLACYSKEWICCDWTQPAPWKTKWRREKGLNSLPNPHLAPQPPFPVKTSNTIWQGTIYHLDILCCLLSSPLSLPLTLGQTKTFLTGKLSTWVTLSWFWILFRNATSKVASLEYQHVRGFSFFLDTTQSFFFQFI